MSGPLGRIKAARLDSPRLQRVLRLLADGRPHTTRGILRKCHVAAVNAIIAELRHHGAEIVCVKQAAPGGHGLRFYYTMTKAPDPK
jgi:hypothetical protein